MAGGSAGSTRGKKKTLADGELFATTSRDIIEADDVEQQLFISAAGGSQPRVGTVVSSVETITIDVDDVVDYEAFIAAEEKKTKQLLAKRKYDIVVARNKQLQASLRDDEVASVVRRGRARKVFGSDFDSFDSFFGFSFETEAFRLKRQRSPLALKSVNLDNYFGKNFKEYQDWTRSARNAFEGFARYFRTEFDKIIWAQQFFRDTPATRWDNYKRTHSGWSREAT